MGEEFGVAAIRHLATAEHLEAGGHFDDAGYHFGICGENAVKSAMREAGLEANWLSIGANALRNSPMRGHWGALSQRIKDAASEINLFAAGRRSAPLLALATGAGTSFDGWHIDIRYADPAYVPVTLENIAAWKLDAAAFVADFVII